MRGYCRYRIRRRWCDGWRWIGTPVRGGRTGVFVAEEAFDAGGALVPDAGEPVGMDGGDAEGEEEEEEELLEGEAHDVYRGL